ncbi:hypothetical protein QBC41DRAFT_304698 [Cercophora samala]|uniref:C2H2-type domain-containing protein n=1 Tax=Cercophora samala TaxID=330535 RepID=A0AA39ZA20_9PEZI|nr:hypothetical protein QBC41DRAFT_304698 [Cercophora samala]
MECLSVIAGISELPSPDTISPQITTPPSMSPPSPWSGYVYAGHSSNEEKALDLECRLQEMESTLKKQGEIIKELEARLQSLRHRRSFKKTLADLILGSSCSSSQKSSSQKSSSQKSHSRSQSSLETHSERSQAAKDWETTPVSPTFDEQRHAYSRKCSSSHNISRPELMNTEKTSPVEMMDTAYPVEMSADDRRRTLDLRLDVKKTADTRPRPQTRTNHALSPFPATSGMSPNTSTGFINSPFASSSQISPASNYNPLATIHTWPSVGDGLHYDTLHRPQECPGGGVWSEAPLIQPSHIMTEGDLSPPVPQYMTMGSSPILSPEFPTSSCPSYFAGASTNSHQETDVAGSLGNSNVWQAQESPILPDMSFLDHGKQMWSSPTTAHGVYCFGSGHGEVTMNSLGAVDPGGDTSTDESWSADGSPVETSVSESPKLECQPCGFYPIAGPDQRKKIEKHKKTKKHRQITGHGIVDTFRCSHCGANYTRRDNLVQHRKIHFPETQADVIDKTAFQRDMTNLGHGLESMPLETERPKKRRRKSSLMSPNGGD